MIEFSVAGETVRVVEPVTPFFVAAMVVTPAATPAAKPEPPIVAAAVFEEVQVT